VVRVEHGVPQVHGEALGREELRRVARAGFMGSAERRKGFPQRGRGHGRDVAAQEHEVLVRPHEVFALALPRAADEALGLAPADEHLRGPLERRAAQEAVVVDGQDVGLRRAAEVVLEAG